MVISFDHLTIGAYANKFQNLNIKCRIFLTIKNFDCFYEDAKEIKQNNFFEKDCFCRSVKYLNSQTLKA